MEAVKNFCSNNFSTNIAVDKKQSRVFQLYRHQKGSQTSRSKAYNMNDHEKRIQRNHSSIFKQSSQQSALFQKGVKKIIPPAPSTHHIQLKDTIKRDYRNKESYDIMRPTPVTESQFSEGGVRKIYLYDQRKESNPYRGSSESRKKYIRDLNKQTDNRSENSEIYLVKKLATHKNGGSEWHNQMTKVEFRKKQNVSNRENIDKQREQKGHKGRNTRQIKTNTKNMSQIVMKENGITLKEGKSEKIDFKQNYYQNHSRLQIEQMNSKSGYLSHRNR